MDQAIDPGTRASLAATPQDGLLAYLGILYRVAHEPTASHWCTPGHNRGGELAATPEATSATPQSPVARAGA